MNANLIIWFPNNGHRDTMLFKDTFERRMIVDEQVVVADERGLADVSARSRDSLFFNMLKRRHSATQQVYRANDFSRGARLIRNVQVLFFRACDKVGDKLLVLRRDAEKRKVLV